MIHSPESRKILGHLLSFKNIGEDGSYESSDRCAESLRIRSCRRLLTDDLRSSILSLENDSYIKIEEAVRNAIGQNGEVDDWMILDMLSETLKEPRHNVLTKVTTSGSISASDGLYFCSEPYVFISRLWPEENPPWIYPTPQIMWDSRIPLVQLQTHLARASGEACSMRVRLLNLPVNSIDADIRIKELAQDDEVYDTHAETFKTEWKYDRKRLARNASVLESFALSCSTVLELRGKAIDGQSRNNGPAYPSAPARPFSDVLAIEDLELDESAAIAHNTALRLISDGQYQGAITNAYTVLHGVCKSVLDLVGLSEEHRSSQNPKDIIGILKKRKPEFFTANTFTSDIAAMRGSMLKILKVLGEVRNNGSTAHSNEIVDKQQAVLCVHMIGSLILYLNACREDYRLRTLPQTMVDGD